MICGKKLVNFVFFSESAMGVKVDAQKNGNAQYVLSVKEMGRIVVDRMLSPIKYHDILYFFTKDYWKERRALKFLHSTTDAVIEERKNILKERIGIRDRKHNSDDIGLKKRMTFLDILLQSTIDGYPLNIKDIREEVDTFMFEVS